MNILDECEIKSLLVRERWSRDTCQWKKLRDCYHPDASKTRVNITWYDGEIDEFVQRSEKLASRNVSIVHVINPADIDIRGFKALAESVGQITSRFTLEGNEYDFTAWCRFINQVEKVDGRWKLLTLEVIYLRDLVAPVPGTPAPDFSDIKDWPRKSYRFAAWHLKRKGLTVWEDLPGDDDEKSVDEVMNRNREWIDSA